ncbi:MAG TPA: hypothetical protein VFD73_27725, partial [Gemmatimonadales bacterium]|nr:hypothetical protein [Gemmatimonadales bacterium]
MLIGYARVSKSDGSQTLAPQRDTLIGAGDLEPRLTRHGYSVRTLAEQFNAKPVEIKRLLHGELDAARARELT